MNKNEYKKIKEKILNQGYKDKKAGIYKITCVPNGCFYIGSTNNLERRFLTHQLDLHYKKHSNRKLQEDYDRYGLFNFKFEPIIKLSFKTKRDKLYDLEQSFINDLKPDYNIQLIVERVKFKSVKKKNKRVVLKDNSKKEKQKISLPPSVNGIIRLPPVEPKHYSYTPKKVKLIELNYPKNRSIKRKKFPKKGKKLRELNKQFERVNERRKEMEGRIVKT